MSSKFVKSCVVLGFQNEQFRGPGVVVTNLLNGLTKAAIPWVSAATGKTNIDDPNMFFSSECNILLGALQYFSLTSQKIDLLGPNVFVMPREAPELIAHSKALVVPSEWCKQKYLKYDNHIIGNKPIYVWPVGVDTETYKNDTPKIIPKTLEESKVLIYFKNREESELSQVITLLIGYGIKSDNISVIKYGSYDKNQLIYACKQADFGVLLDHTESQGLATLEMLSLGLPLLVFNQTKWQYLNDASVVWEEATSVPYFDDNCGMIIENFAGNFGLFFNNVLNGKYKPRKYVVENLSLEKQANDYYKIILEASKLK